MDFRTEAILNELRSDLSSASLSELPATIVECFTKLWLESCESTSLEKLVPKEFFEPVFESMRNEFVGCKPKESNRTMMRNESVGCKPKEENRTVNKLEYDESIQAAIICEICEEDYSITNNDIAYSYFAHTQTAKHMEIIRTFQSEMTTAAQLNEIEGITPSPSCSYKNNNASSRLIENGIIEDDEGLHVCFLCNLVIERPERIKKHIESAEHTRNMSAQLVIDFPRSSNSKPRASRKFHGKNKYRSRGGWDTSDRTSDES